MRLVTAAPVLVLSLVVTTSSMAAGTFPVSIPQECVELAQREGVPVVMESKYQAAKAKLKLARMSNRDPLVRECRAAVIRAQQAVAQANPVYSAKQ